MVTFVNGEFWPILLGHTLCALTGPFYIVSCTIFTTNWFNEKERNAGTALITTAGPLGSGISFVLVLCSSLDQSYDTGQTLLKVMTIQNCMFAFVYIWFMIFFREKPEHPPSAAA